MGARKSLKGAEAIFLALLVIGLIGLLFLLIYGNLAGNLGFDRDTTTYNETGAWLNTTPYTIDGRSLEGYESFAITGIWNYTAGIAIPVANYTADSTAGTIVNATTSPYESIDINLTYTVTHRGTSELNTDKVIGNLTGGATQFFTFSNVWFILTAITILIGIVLGVIALVRGTGGVGGSKSSRTEFTT